MQRRSARLLALSIGLTVSAGVLVLGVCTGSLALRTLRRPPIEGPDPDSLPITQKLATQEVDLLETLFRYQIEHNTSGVPRAGSNQRVYVSLGEHTDPPQEILARFRNHVPGVDPVSVAGDIGPTPAVGDRIVFRATHIRWIDNDTVEIEGGYYCGGLCGSGNTYRAQRKAGTWTVVSDIMHWVS